MYACMHVCMYVYIYIYMRELKIKIKQTFKSICWIMQNYLILLLKYNSIITDFENC